MNTFKIGLLSIVFSLGASVHALTCDSSTAAPANSYPLFCKGKLSMQTVAVWSTSNGLAQMSTQTTVLIPFGKFGSAGGNNGINLAPGTCAWVDRAVNSSEPSTIQTFVNVGDSSSTFFAIINRCMADSTCVFGACATNTNGALNISPWTLETHN